jgi:hypothetical protein
MRTAMTPGFFYLFPIMKTDVYKQSPPDDSNETIVSHVFFTTNCLADRHAPHLIQFLEKKQDSFVRKTGFLPFFLRTLLSLCVQ